MITNERQYRISKSQRAKLQKAIDGFDMGEATGRIGSKVLAKAELEALQSEAEILSEQLREYEALKTGAVTVLEAQNLDELPGILIRARIARGLSQRQLAEKLGLKEQQIQRYESEGYASAKLRRLSEIASALELSVRKIAALAPHERHQSTAKSAEIPCGEFPLREMYRRNWFEGFTGSLKEAFANQEELIRTFVQSAMPRRQPALLRHKARRGMVMDTYALWAWQCQVLRLAKKATLQRVFSLDSLTDDYIRELAQESRFRDGPRRARERLAEVGIALVVEPHLPRTYLDGAAFLLPHGSPVVGMTLRYDRLDNFWFVLFHELFHVKKHLRKRKLEDIFDDLDEEPDGIELEANRLASNALIPEDTWELAMARYLRTRESVKSLAEELRIHESIVAGRIRSEAENYTILSDLIGAGEARLQFPEVQFAL